MSVQAAYRRAGRQGHSLIYTDAAVKGYRLFNIDESFDDVTNLYDINQHPNEVMTVDPVWIHAKKVSDANCRKSIGDRCTRHWKISA